jgi:hypothetical protein
LESNAVGVFVRHAQSKRKGVGGRNAALAMPGTFLDFPDGAFVFHVTTLLVNVGL